MKRSFLFFQLLLIVGLHAFSQNETRLDTAIRRLAAEKDPQKSVSIMKAIIKEHKLDKNKDAETLDVLYGTVAVSFAMKKDHIQFEKYIGLIRNKFNQTSFMNMAAEEMLNNDIDPAYAKRIAEKTLALYQSFKNDTAARPKEFSNEDWKRFMHMAQFPYYDTYAHALFALQQYDKALRYQKMAFMGSPEEGLPGSVERYARLLELTGQKEQARLLLLNMARLGKLSKGMTAQLQSIYISSGGSDRGLGILLDSLQKNIQASLVSELKPKMLNEIAPAFSLKDIDGREVKLSDFRGKTVVLDLWATWCKPCIASFPAMQLMVKKHPEIAFLFIAVQEKDADPLPRVKQFIEKGNYPFHVLIDEPVAPGADKSKIIDAYRPDGIPAKYIIDKNGMLRFKSGGFDTDAALMNELEAMFKILGDL